MKRKVLTCNEAVEKLKDVYNKGVIVNYDCEFGSMFITNLDHLQVIDDNEKIIMQDDNDSNITINKSSIRSTTISGSEESIEQLDIGFDNSKMTFILFN